MSASHLQSSTSSLSSFTPTLHFSVSLCHGSHYRLTLLVGRRLMNFSFPAHDSTQEWWNPDSGACVGGHVSRWRWKHRFIEVGSANNYSSSNADRAALNSACLGMRKSEGWGIQDAIPGISLGKLHGALDCWQLCLLTWIYIRYDTQALI